MSPSHVSGDISGDISDIPDILRKIIARRRERLAEARAERPEATVVEGESEDEALDATALLEAADQPFLAALATAPDAGRAGRAVIAEVKMGSPRLGSLAGRFDPEEQARIYAANGAAALSVVVEPDFFHGSYELLKRCTEASGLPAIAKDFIVDDLQLLWAKEEGASAILLIAALYDGKTLRDTAQKARGLGLVPLVETHDPADLEKLAGVSWELVGVNNRDLRSFDVDLEHSLRLLPRLPGEAIKVAESGLHDPADLERLSRAGFGAFLIGESLVTADDPAAKLRELVG